MEKKVIEKVNDLIQLDVDAVLAYQQAIDACELTEIRTKLKAFQDDHQRHIGDLSDLVTAAGEKPKVHRDLKGFIIEGFTAVMSRGDHTALLAMRGNEELTTRSYHAALGEELPPDVREVIERNYTDEQRHLAWIKNALDSEMWKQTEGEAAVSGGADKKGKDAA